MTDKWERLWKRLFSWFRDLQYQGHPPMELADLVLEMHCREHEAVEPVPTECCSPYPCSTCASVRVCETDRECTRVPSTSTTKQSSCVSVPVPSAETCEAVAVFLLAHRFIDATGDKPVERRPFDAFVVWLRSLHGRQESAGVSR